MRAITKKEEEYANYDQSMIQAADEGLRVFNEYYAYMRTNDIYWVACILDPRVKTKWLLKNVPEARQIVQQIKDKIKKKYQVADELPESQNSQQLGSKKKKSLSFSFLEEYAETILTDDDVERYLDTPTVKAVLNPKENQLNWVMNWWVANKQEYPIMWQVVRDYLVVPAAETDVERLFNIGRDMLGIRRMAMTGETT